jgi:hypothetical protein
VFEVAGSRWDAFVTARPELLRRLAEPVRAGIRRHDTTHPAFHGCVDWHSAVHATYALFAVARMTGDASARLAAVDAIGGVRQLAAEEQSLRSGMLDVEIPYGLAWLLILDREAMTAGVPEFHELAALGRDLLLVELARAAFVPGVTDEEHGNLIWPAVALARWGLAFNDAEALTAARQVATRLLSDASLYTTGWHGFLSPAHLTLLLAADTGVVGDGTVVHALNAVALETVAVTNPISAHAAGLNFSRAWGVYAAYRLTEDTTYRDIFADLLFSHVDLPQLWLDDYLRHSHWVPQFGIFAIAETLPL